MSLWADTCFLPCGPRLPEYQKKLEDEMRRLIVALWVLAFTPALAFAQNAESRRDQYYLFVAPGGTNSFTFGSTTGTLHFGGGAEGFVYKGLAIGAEAGFLAPVRSFQSGFGLLDVNSSYHFISPHKTKKVVPFITGGYSLSFGSGVANGVNFGGGVNWWMRDRLALRLEARDHILSVRSGPTPQAWEFRIGFSFR
jgi:hypothetical protein